MRRSTIGLVLLLAPAILCAQGRPGSEAGRPAWPGVSARAVAELRQVEDVLKPFGTREAANDQGFAPVLGWVPTMGVHWVSDVRMTDGKRFELSIPDQLMYSRVEGKETLVGAAYAYLTTVADTVRPVTFDGNPRWHEHPNLAPEGQTLVMLHVWFVPSPDGPFAENNPNLPFWAMGLTPPAASKLRDPESGTRIRKASLAIGEVVDSAGRFPVLQRRNLRLAAELGSRRAVARMLIPQLAAAQKAGNWEEWGRVAGLLAIEWDAMRDAYLRFAPNAQARERMSAALNELVGHAAVTHHH